MAESFFSQWMKHRTDPSKLARETIRNIDRYDKQDIQSISLEMKDFRKAADSLENVIDTGRVLFDDAYVAFVKADPQVRDRGEMRPSHLINHSVANEMVGMPEYEQLRQWTTGDVVSAAMAAVTIEPQLESLADRAKKQQQEAEALQKRMEEFYQALEGQQDIDEMIEQMKNQPDFDPEFMEKLQQQIQEAMDQMQGDLEAEAGEVDQNAQDAMRIGAAALRAALDSAASQAEQMQGMLQTWGVEPGQLQKMDAQRRLEIANKIRNIKGFEQMTEMIGLMERVAWTEQKRKVYHSNEEVYDVGTGNDLSRVLPSEFSTLLHPVLRLDFFRKFVERQLLVYEMQGTERIGKGALIVMMDNSGSMTGAPEQWAKGMGLACLDIAKRQKRAFMGIHFASSSQMRVFDFSEPDKVEVDDVIEYASHFFGGGTDARPSIRTAVKKLQDEFDEKGFITGDLVLVTDGIFPYPPDELAWLNEARERLGFRVFGFLINASQDMEPFKSICDKGVTIKDLLSADDARDLFRDL